MAVTWTQNIDNMFTTTWAKRKTAAVEQAYLKTPFFFWLKEKGKVEEQKGYRRVEIPLEYGKNETVKWIGKGSTMPITEGELFKKDTKVRHVFVDGVPHEIKIKEKPKGDPNAVVDPRGEWSIVFDMGARTINRTWTIDGDKDAYTGSAETAAGTVDIESIELKGNAMTVTLPGRRGSQEITVIIDGDTFEGTTEMGPRSVTITGSRTSGPDGGAS